MSQVPLLCRWLLKLTAPVVPAAARSDWEREWYGEVWHWMAGRVASGDREAARMALSHCAGAFADALQLRRADPDTRDTLTKFSGHPALPVAVLAAVLLVVAIASGGFERTRRLWSPLPYRATEQLVVLRQVDRLLGARLGLPLVKIPAWRKARKLEGIAAYTGYHALIENQSSWFEANAAAVDPDFFQVLGVTAEYGRLFHEVDASVCGDCVVVSHTFWKNVLGGDPKFIGRICNVAGKPRRVIGVLPQKFWFFSDSPAVWTTLQNSGFVDPRAASVYAIARIRPGADTPSVIAELLDLYWKLPPMIRGRILEARSIESLTRDPLYKWLPLVAFGAFALFAALVCLLPATVVRWRSWTYLGAKTALALSVVAAAVAEFAHARAVRISGMRGFGPETVSLWLLMVGSVILVGWAWHDQRKRCRTCLRRLSMPVRMGSRGHVLMDPMSTETACPNGHGLLWAQEDSLESYPDDRWLKLDDSWKDLFAVPGGTKGAQP